MLIGRHSLKERKEGLENFAMLAAQLKQAYSPHARGKLASGLNPAWSDAGCGLATN